MNSYTSMLPVKKTVGIPPTSVQARILPNPYSTPPQDVWEFAISRAWLSTWASQGVPASSLEQSTLSRDPRTPLGPVTVKEMDIENCYVGESVWTVLLSWYGLDPGSLKRRRHVNPSYLPLDGPSGDTEHIMVDKCLDILMLNLCPLGDLESTQKHNILQLYAWDTVVFWEEQLKRKLAIADTHQTRLWLVVQYHETETCHQLPQGSHQSVMYHVCQACPQLVGFMVKRQRKFPAPEHQTSFSSFHSSLSSGYFPEDADNTKSFLFQELLLEKYKITIAVEEVVPDQPATDAFAFPLASFGKGKPVPGDQSQPWEGRLKEVLDKISTNMHEVVDEQRERTQAVSRFILKNTLEECERLKAKLKEKIKENEVKAASLAAQEKDVSERESMLNEKLQKFKVGLSDFLLQKKRLEEEMKKIEEMNRIAESKVRLNVGGHHFETSIDTLTKDPDSVLGFMFSGRHPFKQEPDGSYFIDRDGSYFREILNFLRDGDDSFSTMPADVKALRELQKEARFYKLNGLIDFVNMRIGN